MRDDVMSYGHQGAVSSITLAALEDLGFYVANYSAAHCMSWGYQQGRTAFRSRPSHTRTELDGHKQRVPCRLRVRAVALQRGERPKASNEERCERERLSWGSALGTDR